MFLEVKKHEVSLLPEKSIKTVKYQAYDQIKQINQINNVYILCCLHDFENPTLT